MVKSMNIFLSFVPQQISKVRLTLKHWNYFASLNALWLIDQGTSKNF